MLNSSLIKNYIDTFYGYGKWSSCTWFIGIEEGGGRNIADIERRLYSWDSFEEKDLIDNQIHHIKIGLECFFVKGTLQSTWRKLILTKLSLENKPTSKSDIINMQKNDWGHYNSENLLIELFPLSSPNNSEWCYSKWTDLDVLKSRESYYGYITQNRIKYIKDKIDEFKPQLIFFYGKKMQNSWDEIIGTNELKEIFVQNSKIRFININNICYIQSPHPASKYSNTFWMELGIKIRELMAYPTAGSVDI